MFRTLVGVSVKFFFRNSFELKCPKDPFFSSTSQNCVNNLLD